MKITLKVSHYGDRRKHQVIMDGHQTLEDLHHEIFREFRLLDEAHLYRFCMPPKKKLTIGSLRSSFWASINHYYDPRDYPFPWNRNASKIKIESLGLKQGQYFYYMFDLGDCFCFTIIVGEIDDDAE